MACTSLLTGVGAAAILALDTFTDANGTALTSHRPDLGAGWTNQGGGGFTIQANQATLNANVGNDDTVDVNEPVVSVQIDWQTPASWGTPFNAGLKSRYQDNANYYQFILDAANATASIQELLAGVFTTRASASQAVNANSLYTLRVSWGGNTLTATVNGGNSIAYTTPALATATQQGIHARADGTNAIALDNFKVTNP